MGINLEALEVFVSGMTTTLGSDSQSHIHLSDRARANHIGTQPASTISDFSEAVDDRVSAFLVPGSGVTFSHKDNLNTLTLHVAAGEGTTDHGGLTGLSDDDHTQYLRVDGGRAATGDFTFEQDVHVQGSGVVSGIFRPGSVAVATNGTLSFYSDVSLPSQSSIIQHFNTKDFTRSDAIAGTNGNSVFSFNTGDYWWGSHMHMDAAARGSFGHVVGVHGPDQVGFMGTVDSASGWLMRGFQSGGTGTDMLRFDSETTWQSGVFPGTTPSYTGTFSGNFLNYVKRGNPRFQVSSDGVARSLSATGQGVELYSNGTAAILHSTGATPIALWSDTSSYLTFDQTLTGFESKSVTSGGTVSMDTSGGQFVFGKTVSTTGDLHVAGSGVVHGAMQVKELIVPGPAASGHVLTANAQGRATWAAPAGGPGSSDADTLEGQPGSYYLGRGNHTGTQASSTISDFNESVDDRVSALVSPGSGMTKAYDDTANTMVLDWSKQRAGYFDARTTTTVVTTSSSFADVTGLAFPVGVNETWGFEMAVGTGCAATGGLRLSMNVPSGATITARLQGMGNATTAMTTGTISLANMDGPLFNNVVNAFGWATMQGMVVNGATPGTAQVRFRSQTNGQQSRVHPSGWITAWQI